MYPARNASATSNRSVRPRTSDWSVAGTSSTSAVCAMSPKSMIPLTRFRSSRSRLSSVTSLWMSWARSAGNAGTTLAANRARTRSMSSRRPGSSSRATRRASSGRCCWSHQIVRPAAGWKRPRSARPIRATTSPRCAIASASRSAGSAVRPGRSGRSRTRCEAPPTSAVTIGDPSSAARATGTGRAGSISAMRSTAATSISTTSGSSTAFETLRTHPAPDASVRRKLRSRSLTRSSAVASQAVPLAGDLLGIIGAERGRGSVENVGGCHRPRS